MVAYKLFTFLGTWIHAKLQDNGKHEQNYIFQWFLHQGPCSTLFQSAYVSHVHEHMSHMSMPIPDCRLAVTAAEQRVNTRGLSKSVSSGCDLRMSVALESIPGRIFLVVTVRTDQFNTKM